MVVGGLEVEVVDEKPKKGFGPPAAGNRMAVYGLNDAEEVGRGVVGCVAAVPAIEVVAEERRHAHVTNAMRGKVVGLEVGVLGVAGAGRGV